MVIKYHNDGILGEVSFRLFLNCIEVHSEQKLNNEFYRFNASWFIVVCKAHLLNNLNESQKVT